MRHQEFFLRNSEFLKGAGYISMLRKDAGIADKVKMKVSLTKVPQFNTEIDPDVIFFLLGRELINMLLGGRPSPLCL